ncbi:MAG TPA: hypothetical protein VGH89_09610 [Pseudonocardia sp.]
MRMRQIALGELTALGLVIGGYPGTAFAATPSPAHVAPMGSGQGGQGGQGGNANVNCGFPVAIPIGPGAGTVTQCKATGGSGGAGGSGGSPGSPGAPGVAVCNGFLALIGWCKV